METMSCSKCGEFLGTIEGNKVSTKYKCDVTGMAYGRYSEAYIECQCGNKEKFIY